MNQWKKIFGLHEDGIERRKLAFVSSLVVVLVVELYLFQSGRVSPETFGVVLAMLAGIFFGLQVSFFSEGRRRVEGGE